jgi:tripartite motif-containing protein 71
VRHIRFLFFVLLFVCCLLTFPGTVFSEGGYQFVTQWGSDPLGDGQLYYPRAVAVDASENVYVVDTGNCRIQKFSSAGVFIEKWGSYGSGDGQFSYPRAVAVDASGNVYVVDTGNDRIQKFSSSGVFITKWGSEGSGDGQFKYPESIAVDASGYIYVADCEKNNIQKFSSSGSFVTKWGSGGSGDGQFDCPRGMAFDASGNIYVVDAVHYRIQKFSSEGVFITKWGSIGTGDGQFVNPNDVAVDASGYVYVADFTLTGYPDGRIQKFSSSGNLVAKWDSQGSGDGQFSYPYGIDVDTSGNIYVADAGNNCIQKLSSEGTFITKWGTITWAGKLNHPYGVAVDASGNVFVADTYNHCIQKFSSSGSFITRWGSYGTGDGQFNSPFNVAVDTSGDVYVADTYNHCIQKFSSSGVFIAKWGSEGSGDGQFNKCPGGMVFDALGNVYVVDGGNHRIQKFSSSGVFLTQWGSQGTGDGQLDSPDEIAIDASGNVYVVDAVNKCIQKFSSSGIFITMWGSFGTGDGQFFFPIGIAVDTSGNVYVVDEGNPKIQKFSSEGTFITKWGSEGSGDGQFNSPYGVAVDSTGNVYVVDQQNCNVQKFAPVPSAGANTNLYFPHIDANLPWQTEIAIINTGDQAANGMLRAFNDEGQHLEVKDVVLSARGRKQIDVAIEFADHADIGYIIFETRFAAFQGYAKFYQEGVYRAAIPAVKEVNTSDIYISHIDSSDQWWTGVSLVNTTATTKELTLAFNNGVNKSIALDANEHKAFSIRSLFDSQPQPDIQSAVIFNANGIIGLEIFGSTDGNQLDGILLTDKMASTLYYPHVAGNNWWTGIAAYNPSDLSCTMTITPYDAQGTALASSALSIASKGKYIGAISALDIPAETTWFRIDSSRPLTGFELLSPVDNQQLAAYAGGVGTGAKEGVFPKIEKDGWTGIAFVNTDAIQAYVSLIAYDDNGTPVDSRAFTVHGHGKVVGSVEDLFLHDISGATYIAYSSDRNIAGFQLNGSADGTMLDGLPAFGRTD